MVADLSRFARPFTAVTPAAGKLATKLLFSRQAEQAKLQAKFPVQVKFPVQMKFPVQANPLQAQKQVEVQPQVQVLVQVRVAAAE